MVSCARATRGRRTQPGHHWGTDWKNLNAIGESQVPFSFRPSYFRSAADLNASNTAGSRENVRTYSNSAPFNESSKASSPPY